MTSQPHLKIVLLFLKRNNTGELPRSECVTSNGTCSGKKSIAEFLIKEHNFALLHLVEKAVPPVGLGAQDPDHVLSVRNAKATPQVRFDTFEQLIDYVTKKWRDRFVTTDIRDEASLELFLRRPFALLVSVDAPLIVRWKRFTSRCKSLNTPPPSLSDFVITSDQEHYDSHSPSPSHYPHQHHLSLAQLTSRAHVYIINNSDSLPSLHAALSALDLPNPSRLRPSWDQYFMQLASLAAQRSNCMKRRVGCVLVRERRVISTGYNGTPRHLRNCNEGGCKRCNEGPGSGAALSTCLCLHAEENALLEAGRERIGSGSVLYCDTCPCLTCAVKITQVGIGEVVYAQGYNMDIDTAEVFNEGGVKLRQFSLPPRNGLVDADIL